MSHTISHLVPGLAVLALAAGGCSGNMNRSISPGPVPLTIYDTAAASAPEAPTEPSLTNGLDRSHWSKVTVTIGTQNIESRPSNDWEVDLTTATARERGAFPTGETALQRPADSGEIWWEAGANIVVGFANAIWSPVTIIYGNAADRVQHNPKRDYDLEPDIPIKESARWIEEYAPDPSMGDG